MKLELLVEIRLHYIRYKSANYQNTCLVCPMSKLLGGHKAILNAFTFIKDFVACTVSSSYEHKCTLSQACSENIFKNHHC